MYKLPKDLIESFIQSEFKYKKTTNGEYRINSIYAADTKLHIYISPEKSAFTDFKTGESGSFIKLVRDYLEIDSNLQAMEYIIKNYGSYEEKEDTEKAIKESDVIKDFVKNDKPIFFKDVKELGPYGRIALSYIQKRNIDPSYIPDMGYVFNEESKFNNRVIVPFIENGTMAYFVARSLDPKNTLRYLNPDKLDSKEYVFNLDNINDEVVICEGTFDAMSITRDQAATCLLSADVGVKQMEKIFLKKPKSIIYVPDQDKTGFEKMDVNIKKLIRYCPYDGLKIYIFDVPNGCKDLNDMKVKTGKNFILKKECSEYNGEQLFNNDWLKSL